eukprot:TRINITY_DN80307_c0_g1_i1.p1 TRINITY_DN80307_c0_g1~~TRINITY_DN80307_c0_g1_i1.p1  ORF type:complete len:451 (-),score=108.28 TRINITY_DN80307_c0_g1_i1:115-1467(-)
MALASSFVAVGQALPRPAAPVLQLSARDSRPPAPELHSSCAGPATAGLLASSLALASGRGPRKPARIELQAAKKGAEKKAAKSSEKAGAAKKSEKAGATKKAVEAKKSEDDSGTTRSRKDKLKALSQMKGLMSLGAPDSLGAVEVISAGPMDVDLALGGGWAKGRIVEVFGPESSGKTTLALCACAEVQKSGGVAVFIDVENALSRDWAETLGVNVEEMWISQPECGEEAFDIIHKILEEGVADLIIVDSVAHLTPKAELENPYEKDSIGLLARLMSKAMRKTPPLAKKQGCTVMFLNQIRMKIGVLYGNPETRCGGRALGFAASQVVEVRRKEQIKGGKDELGPTALVSRIKVVKNKIAPPFREAEMVTDFEQGVLKQHSLLLAAEKRGVCVRRGAYWYMDEQKLGQGIVKAAERVTAEPELQSKIEMLVRDAASKPKKAAPDDDDEAE